MTPKGKGKATSNVARPRARKQPKMAKKTVGQPESRPIARTRAVGGGYQAGSFKDLEGRPGVVVLGRDATFPYQAGGLSRTLSAARSKYYLGMTQTIYEAYKGMDKRYRQYRSDSLVRGCINSLALWATKEGFDTVVEPVQEDLTPEQEQQIINQYLDLKAHIDGINQRVNLDHVLRAAIIKAKIWGKAGFEIEYDPKSNEPLRLISLPLLNQYDLRPHVDEDWTLQGFWWRGQIDFYKPSDLLYFVNGAIESDHEGLSDIEPILDDLETRGKIRQEDLKEAATTLWAGVAIHSLDVDRLPAGLTQADVQAIIDEHVAALRPGKHIATDNRWSITVVDLKPDLQKLIEVKKDLDQEIIGNFQVPKFILNRTEQVNRATSYSQLESFVDGPISDIQRWIKRTVEAQWYDQLTRAFLKVPEGQELPVRVRHRWREIRTTDFFQLLNAVSTAFADGLVDQEKGYELMRDGPGATFDPVELKQLGAAAQEAAEWVTIKGQPVFLDDGTEFKSGDKFTSRGNGRTGTILGPQKATEAFPGSKDSRAGYKVQYDDTEYPYANTEGIGGPGTGSDVNWDWIPAGAALPVGKKS